MGIYVGDQEMTGFYRTRFTPGWQVQRATSVWVGDKRVFPPAGRELILEFTPTQWDESAIISTNLVANQYRNFRIKTPWWATAVDCVYIGGGNGGNGGSGSVSWNHGTGGRSAPWVSGTFVPSHAETVVLAGLGGAGASERESPGSWGGASSVALPNQAPPLGQSRPPVQPSGYGDHWGQSPGNHTAFDRSFTGGSGGDRGNPGYPGSAPGAGGGGGNGGTFLAGRPGGRGGDGYAWIRFRSD